MQEAYYVGSYWGPRQETALECARRAESFLSMLARCESSFAQWYRAGRGSPRELPGHPVLPESKTLEKLFLGSRSRGAVGKTAADDSGFSRILWNAKRDATDLHLTCGGSSPWGPPNACWLDPPWEGEVRKRLLQAPVLARILTTMATTWDPDYGIASSTEMVDLVKQRKWEVRVGWLTYLSRRLGTLPPLPAPVRIEPVGTSGWLLVLSSEPMTAHDPEHVALTRRVRELLDRAGLIAVARPEPTDG